ncbi:hypothetical protein EYF80_028836 [Liparis tanakae]|uniref:Bridge-like lipid transfer protein family member 1 middle region domain-containing protein n=1 Tax=Liparis tanakae TaxID=230148 RepID=A0A4Z2H5H9_9TELE|nr:hypothetical protein EYF80_028836 [Liparis tanakae]
MERYIESMVHFASIRHPAAILDDLHGKVLNEAYQISKSTSQTGKQEHKLSKTEGTTPGSLNITQGQTDLSVKPDNVKIKGLQANVSIPKVNLCLLQASVEEGSPSCSSKCVTHVSLVALCFDRIATQFRMNRGIVEETPNAAEHGRPSVMLEKQLNLLSTATPAIGAWLVPIDQLKSSLRKLTMEGTLRVCAVMGCIMTEALEKKSIHIPIRSKYNRVTKRSRYLHENPSCMLCNILHRYLHQADYSVIEEATMNDGVPALVTLKKGLVALARQWMKFIVVTQGFKAIGLMRPNPLAKPKEAQQSPGETILGLDNGAALQSDTSADGAEFEFDAATVSEHTMLLEGACSRPPPKEANSGPVSGVEIMRKLSKSHTHNESALRIKGSHPYQSLSYTSGDTAADSPAHVCRAALPAKDSPRKESLLSNLTGSFRSLHNLLESMPQRSEAPAPTAAAAAAKRGSLTRTGNSLGTDMLTEHPLLSEPSSVSFYNWMSNAVGNRTGAVSQDPANRSQHNSLQTGQAAFVLRG